MGLEFLNYLKKTLQASNKIAVRKIFAYRRVKSYWGIWGIR
jgi:hypothetical protein